MSRPARRALALAVAPLVVPPLLVAAAARARASNGAAPITSSPKSAGRGGAEIAVGDDSYTATTNPAGLTNVTGTRIDLAAAFYVAQVTFTDSRNHGRDAQSFPSPTPSLGFVQALGSPDPADGPDAGTPFAVGLAVVPVVGGNSHAAFRTALFPEGERETSKLAVLGVTAGFAFRIHPRVSLGLGITGLYASLSQESLAGGTGDQTRGLVRNFKNGQVDPTDPNFLINGQPASWQNVLNSVKAPNTFSSSQVTIDSATGWGVQGTIGALFQVLDELSIGVAYKTPGYLSPLEGRAFLDASRATSSGAGGLNTIQADFLGNHLPDGGAGLTSKFDARISGLTMPQTLGVGAALWPHPRVLLALDVKWINWRDAFNEVTVDLKNGNSRDLSEITSNQTSSNLTSKVLYRWHDQEVLAVGGAFAATDWLRLRAGYNFGNDPIPGRTENPFNAGTVEHHACVGSGLVFGPFSVDVAWVHAFPKSTSITDNAQKPDYNGVRHKADQDAVLVGAALEL